ncbi:MULTISPECIES: UbiA family prenyltransferase [Myxococcaceae]|uniref:UbiA family prenyltransferase n=1 Tax=Myxococcaceae TaxID=31 RepID=UPI00188E670B|nr:UbiA family prenyltransferase [Simulacricoccus sp. 17bor-14]
MNPPSETLAAAPLPPGLPLVVDLDGTLTRTDTLHESLLLLLKQHPLLVLLVPLWLLKGKAHLKAELARRVVPDAAHLPYDEGLLAYLRAEHARGRRLVLATAADRRVADAVAQHLGLFERVHASEGGVNLRGARKLASLRSSLGADFHYAGNERDDLAVWRECAGSVVVNAPGGVVRAAQALGRPVQVFQGPRARARTWLKAVRVHQWAKNLLLFVPLLAAHRVREPALLVHAALAFASFSLCASSVYVLNDLLDLEADRQHPSKCRRPFACGLLPLKVGLVLAPLLLVAGFGIALAWLPREFVLLLCAYYAVTLAYSFYLKQVMVLDVLVLAGLYTVRILGGALAVGVRTSSWLFSFSMFLFLSLALVKRLSEVRRLRMSKQEVAHGRGYFAGDLEQLGQLGTSSGYLAVLVLALYISSEEVRRLYDHPERLWLLCPVMLYWVSRVWLLAHRGEVNEDPLVFALRDKVSYAVGLAATLVILLAA